jgi:neutral ceramidase
MTRSNVFVAALFFASCSFGGASAQELKAGAAAEPLAATDSMVIGGGIGPGKAVGQEGLLRASAVVIEDPHHERIALVACDVLMINRDILDVAAHRIEATTGIPLDHILINATHTHHAPTTVTVHGYERDLGFTKQVEDKIVAAATRANHALVPVTFRFRLGEESSVGKNSRLLLGDGTIYWVGSYADAVRPTGPFDPELPVLAFQRTDGRYQAILFNHSTHTIGTLKPGVRSPSFYGLAAQALETETGGTVLFFEGASGSTHNLDVKPAEATYRIQHAVAAALDAAQPRVVSRVRARRKEITVRVRKFREADDDRAVAGYCTKRIGENRAAQSVIDTFRAMRKSLAPLQGEDRKTWVQALLIGDVAIVGVPGEFFTVLGQEIKRRSPFRYTYVFELANDYVGYIPDRVAFDRGGYQVWTGLHSFLERGTGELIVATAVDLLHQLDHKSLDKSGELPGSPVRNARDKPVQ